MNIPATSGINTNIEVQTMFPNVTVCVPETIVTLSTIPVVPTGFYTSDYIKAATVSGNFILSGAGKVSISIINNIIVISGIN